MLRCSCSLHMSTAAVRKALILYLLKPGCNACMQAHASRKDDDSNGKIHVNNILEPRATRQPGRRLELTLKQCCLYKQRRKRVHCDRDSQHNAKCIVCVSVQRRSVVTRKRQRKRLEETTMMMKMTTIII